jgi:hypothetical protein
LLVRLSGGMVMCQDPLFWETMATWDVTLKKGMKQAIKQMKRIGQGGTVRLFLQQVHPYTRSLRIVLAVARGWEAKVDNRLYEVGVAEAMAFMGNRVSRFWGREFTDWATRHICLPLMMALAPYGVSQNPRPILIAMGFLRAVLPFAASFQGSRFGRQVTFNTYRLANWRWKPIQSIMTFHESAGVYQDTNLDPELLDLARQVSERIGHGADPVITRMNIKAMGFTVFGSGSGGYTVFRLKTEESTILLHVTPYGPSILDEMPRYIRLERRHRFYGSKLANTADATMLDAATPRDAKLQGFTYSGAFFSSQEWAALKIRFDRELFGKFLVVLIVIVALFITDISSCL